MMHNSASEKYQSAHCIFEYDQENDGSIAVGDKFSYMVDGRYISTYLEDGDDDTLDLIPELHRVMKEHAGGSWTKMILTLDANGRADTQFVYPDE